MRFIESGRVEGVEQAVCFALSPECKLDGELPRSAWARAWKCPSAEMVRRVMSIGNLEIEETRLALGVSRKKIESARRNGRMPPALWYGLVGLAAKKKNGRPISDTWKRSPAWPVCISVGGERRVGFLFYPQKVEGRKVHGIGIDLGVELMAAAGW